MSFLFSLEPHNGKKQYKLLQKYRDVRITGTRNNINSKITYFNEGINSNGSFDGEINRISKAIHSFGRVQNFMLNEMEFQLTPNIDVF